MKLKATLNKAAYDALPAGLKDAYIKGEGEDEFVLEGVDEKEYGSKLNEFRTNNKALMKDKEELEHLKEKFKDIDPVKVKEYEGQLAKINAMEEGELLKAGKIDEVIATRTKRMREDYESQINAKDKLLKTTTEEKEAFKSKLGVTLIDAEVQRVINDVAKPREKAVPDILGRAKTLWSVDEKGNIVARNADGKQAFGSDGEPLTLKEWSQGLLKEAPHLFESAAGGGAGGGTAGNGGGNGKQIDGNDPLAIGRNLKDVASGKITAVTG